VAVARAKMRRLVGRNFIAVADRSVTGLDIFFFSLLEMGVRCLAWTHGSLL